MKVYEFKSAHIAHFLVKIASLVSWSVFMYLCYAISGEEVKRAEFGLIRYNRNLLRGRRKIFALQTNLAMVIVRRRSSTSSTTSPFQLKRIKESPVSLSYTSEVKMGDGRHSPTEWMAHYPPTSPFNRSPTKPVFACDNIPVTRYDMLTSRQRPNWWTKAFALFSVVSCMYTGRNLHSSKRVVRALEHEIREMMASFERADNSRGKAQSLLLEVKAQRSDARDLNEKLKHEVKMIEMMLEEGVDMHAPIKGEGTVGTWMNERHVGLRRHLHTLRDFVQYQSREVVLERFGPGPHRVEIRVQIQVNDQMAEDKFVIEMFSTDDVPHSVLFFLNTVEKQLWDNTIFLHHEEIDHIMAAVPLDYKNQGIKQADIQALELQSLAFPEYSAKHPHEKYTVGFVDIGPTFFINTDNNTIIHGPGAQEHHQLPEDAEPCFARVIEGVEVVDALMKYGLQSPNRVNPAGNHPWSGSDHMWSRIVSIRILLPLESTI